jgi:hypothetical protein
MASRLLQSLRSRLASEDDTSPDRTGSFLTAFIPPHDLVIVFDFAKRPGQFLSPQQRSV